MYIAKLGLNTSAKQIGSHGLGLDCLVGVGKDGTILVKSLYGKYHSTPIRKARYDGVHTVSITTSSGSRLCLDLHGSINTAYEFYDKCKLVCAVRNKPAAS